MTALVTTINELADSVLPALWRASWQGGAALLLVCVLFRALRRMPAQAQCWLWRLAYWKLLIAGVWLVPVELRWLPPPQPTADAMPATTAVEPPAPAYTSPIVETPREEADFTSPLRPLDAQPASTAKVAPRLSGPGWLLLAWAAGVTFMLANLTRHGIRIRRLLSRLTPVADVAIIGRLSAHCRQMRVARPPAVRVAEGAGSPFLVGVLRPVIVLPAAVIDACTDDELDAALIHELAHIRRRDLAWNWLPALAETAFFFHPLVWLTRREWRTAQEIATDELAVTASRMDVTQYANSLIALITKSPDPTTRPHLAVALSEAYTQLARRMQAMQTFQPLTTRRRVTIAATVLALAAGLVPWKLTAQESQKTPAAEGTSGAVNRAEVAQSDPATEDNEAPQTQTRPITVSGRALDTHGRPIAGAKMYLSSRAVDWKRLAQTVTDQNGSYEFRDVPLPLETSSPFGGPTSGRFEVFGMADGYGFGWRPPQWYFPERYPSIANSNWEEEDPPERFYADEPIELDVTFRPAAKLGGRIVDDTGRPIPGTSVAIRYCDLAIETQDGSLRGGTEFDSLNARAIVPPEVKLRHTDADGRFEFTALPADCRFRIDVRPPGFPSRWIWAVTRDEFPAEAAGKPVYGDGMLLEFVRAAEVALQIAYGDSGAPADRVLVSAMNQQGSSGAVSDHEGHVSLRLSPGEYEVELLPRIGTPYLVTSRSLTVPAEKSASAVEVLLLDPAAIVEVSIIDERTGAGIADVDFWSCDAAVPRGQVMSRRDLHYFRSYEAATRICHVERPRTDADGKLRALFEPGRYRIGVGLNSFPHKDYLNLDTLGEKVDLEAGKTTQVTFRVRRREPADGADARNNQPGRTITIRVVDQGGRSVEGAKVFRNHVYRPEGEERTRIENETYWTDAKGKAVVALSGTSVDLRLWVRKENFVPLHAMWAKDVQSDGDQIPAEFTFQLDPGTVIGGIVKNEAGEPIEGVRIEVNDRTTTILNMFFNNSKEQPVKRPVRASGLAGGEGAVLTDADGRWRLGTVPSDETLDETLNGSDEIKVREASLRRLQQVADRIRPLKVALRLSHPDYADDYEAGGLQQQQEITHKSLRDQTATIVMKRGNTLTGQVTDPDGSPVADATVLLRDAYEFSSRDPDVVRTDEKGEYRFEHLAGPPRVLMVHAAGWPVEVRPALANEPSTVDVRLRPPRKVAVQFLDRAGNLVPDVRVSLVEWNGRRIRELYYADALNGHFARRSDANGSFEWTAAASDKLLCDFWKAGYQTIQGYTLTPAEGVYVVTLMRSPNEND